MPFCPNCGNEINEGVVFCGNCGKQVKNTSQSNKPNIKIGFDKVKEINGKKVLAAVKTHFSSFYVNYNSLLFKFAMIIFLAVGIGESLYDIANNFIPEAAFEWFQASSALYNLGFCLLLFGVFSLILLKRKETRIEKSSIFFDIFWLVTIVLNLIVFIAGINLYQYILYAYIAREVIAILMAVSTALLLYVKRPKYPIALVITLLSFALQNSSLWVIKLNCMMYKFDDSFKNLMDIFGTNSLGFILLVVSLFIIRYFIPEKISKWLVYIPTLLMIANSLFDLIENFNANNIIDFITELALIVMFLAFALSCSKKPTYKCSEEKEEKTSKSAIKVSIISLSSVIAITLVYLLVTAIICSAQINSSMVKWKDRIANGNVYPHQWDIIRNDLFKYNSTKLASAFIDDYSEYESIKENIGDLETISKCYNGYTQGNIGGSFAEEYADVSVEEYWKNDAVLSGYYQKYMEMKPDADKVSASVRINVDSRKITVTITNDNVLPISKCVVKSNFTIGYIEGGYYSDTEYGRGSKEFTIENIPGNSKKTEEFEFDPDLYYDSYGSYLLAFLWEQSTSLVSIE